MDIDGRKTWTDFRPTACSTQNPRSRQGSTLHWTGASGSEFRLDHDGCLAAVAGIEEYQLNLTTYDYCAIEYNLVVCRHGRVIQGRGVGVRSGANGTAESNLSHGSILLLMGQPDDLPVAMRHGVRQAARILAPNRPKAFVPHHKWKATACPGPKVTAWIEKGCPDPVIRAAIARLTEKIKDLRRRRREKKERA
jgi:hypothetical protein